MCLRIDVRDGLAAFPASIALLLGYLSIGSAIAAQPLILDTQYGIQDGKAGRLMQTAPLSSEPIVQPAQPRTPAGQASNTTMPIYVVPYLNLPNGGGSVPAQSQPQPRQP